MAYTPREIKDRVAVGDDIFQVEDLGNNRIKLTPTPTHVSEAGTPVNKALLQPIEDFLATLGTGGVIPPGGIIMWSGAINDIPVGWVLCNGSNGTPDLRNRFVVGAGSSYSVGNTGGRKDVTLTTSQLPAHNHSASSNPTGAHTHNISASSAGGHTHSGTTSQKQIGDQNVTGSIFAVTDYLSNAENTTTLGPAGRAAIFTINPKKIDTNHSHAFTTSSNGSHSHTGTAASAGAHSHSITVNNTGSGSSHENRPPYYALAYIMKL